MLDEGTWVGPPEQPDRYRLIALLGAGGEGEVWRAVDRATRSEVAVKISTASSATDGPWHAQTTALRRLRHPNLVRLRDAFLGPAKHLHGDAAGDRFHRYCVMDYVAGIPLSDWLAEHPEASTHTRNRLLRHIAAAIDALHRGTAAGHPVAHGDIKPANIVITPGGKPVLLDLGLSRLVSTSGFTGRSNPYAAPEQRGNNPQATPAADAYAFAVTTAYTLTGAPPPTSSDGFLDTAKLARLLRRSHRTRYRPLLRRRLLGALHAPAEQRPTRLRWWITDRRAATLAAAGAVALAGVLTATSVSSPQPSVSFAQAGAPSSATGASGSNVPHATLTKAAHPSDTVPPFEPVLRATVTWPVVGCSPGPMGAPASLLPGVYSTRNIATTIVRAGGGAWFHGALDVVVSVSAGHTARITTVTADITHTAAPAWVYEPLAGRPECVPASCEDCPALFDIDLERGTVSDPPASTSPGPRPPYKLGAHAPFLEIDAWAQTCLGNYRFSLIFTYYVPGDPAPHQLRTTPVTIYGVADHTTFYQGYQNRDGSITAQHFKRSGADRVCAGQRSSPLMDPLPGTGVLGLDSDAPATPRVTTRPPSSSSSTAAPAPSTSPATTPSPMPSPIPSDTPAPTPVP